MGHWSGRILYTAAVAVAGFVLGVLFPPFAARQEAPPPPPEMAVVVPALGVPKVAPEPATKEAGVQPRHGWDLDQKGRMGGHVVGDERFAENIGNLNTVGYKP